MRNTNYLHVSSYQMRCSNEDQRIALCCKSPECQAGFIRLLLSEDVSDFRHRATNVQNSVNQTVLNNSLVIEPKITACLFMLHQRFRNTIAVTVSWNLWCDWWRVKADQKSANSTQTRAPNQEIARERQHVWFHFFIFAVRFHLFWRIHDFLKA